MSDIKVTTSKKGIDYRVSVGDRKYRVMADLASKTVTIYTGHAMLGVWFIERFDGALSPASIRKFFGKV